MHNIIPVEDICTPISTIGKQIRIPCKVHDNQIYCIFCKICYELVCPACLLQNHQKHNSLEIEGILKQQFDKLKNFDN